MKTPEIYPSKLPALKSRPPADDHTPEGTFILLFNEAIEIAGLLNLNAINVYVKQCEFWQTNAERYAWAKIPPPPKPPAPLAWVVKYQDVNPYGPIGPQASIGSDRLAGPCPDLEPDGVKIVPPPADPVGEAFGGADPWYRVLPGDVTPIGFPLRDLPKTEHHPVGTFTRRERATPFGSFQYFEKQG